MNSIDEKQLPHLLSLLDDDSPAVQKVVKRSLMSFGDVLEEKLAKLSTPPTPKQWDLMKELLDEQRRQRFRQNWNRWQSPPKDIQKLESAYDLLAQFQHGANGSKKLSELLNQLAKEFQEKHQSHDPLVLSKFLFQEKAIAGARSDYYNPRNSELIHVIEQKQGIPISLANLYMLVGARLGIDIEGCNFPGHFLARAFAGNQMILIDCFEQGKPVDETRITVADLDSAQILQRILETKTTTETIFGRILRNLSLAYEQSGEFENSQLMTELLKQLTEKS